jgi:nitroimidazol reductase NimA-like FMN-containing flavoprotein (pyridoxamine 5'-phosphate oxidase superfamily)
MNNKDESTFGVMSPSECHQLLGAGTIGRIGVVVDGYPLIIPLNYAMDGETVVVRTEPGTVVARADQTRVSFQIDGFDPADRSGWSVLMRGRAQALTVEDRDELIERTRATGVTPWAPGDRSLWIRIEPADLSGRRIKPGDDLQWSLGYAAYM